MSVGMQNRTAQALRAACSAPQRLGSARACPTLSRGLHLPLTPLTSRPSENQSPDSLEVASIIMRSVYSALELGSMRMPRRSNPAHHELT